MLLLATTLLILCAIARGVMVAHYIPMQLWQEHLNDFVSTVVALAQRYLFLCLLNILIYVCVP